uniref:Cytochrome c oxidase subunit 2 n=1 Tax=Succinea erythrophana TaxID=3003847 RepID=A0A9E9ETS1_9EUPU|nr:cytochrome c oxidase subunit II [Succinea erythrophana]WAO26024.1 cytochrome c oxidase subunit 2 [Succinea erythrophana]
MSYWGQLNLMDPSSPIQIEMIFFHDHAMILLIGIFTLVAIMGIKLLLSNFSCRSVYEAQTIEIIWTIIPAFLLIWLALPSLRLLYLLDEQFDNSLIFKSTGHQWYWSYEIPSLGINSFDSYMIKTEDLSEGSFRLLEVDNRLPIPLNINSSIIATSSDVIHAWTIPSLGVKLDAVPGRLNSMSISPIVSGIFYGQCSEICGANHSFMPIVIETMSL